VSDNSEHLNPVDPVVKPFVDFWSSYIQQANEATEAWLGKVDADPKAWQQNWFQTVSKSMDAYLRSPVFLQAMKHNADLVIKAKEQADDLSKEIARNANIPTTSDISGLFERFHSAEEVILSRLDAMEEQLGAIQRRLDENHEQQQ